MSEPVALVRPRDAQQLCAALRSTVALEIRRAGLVHQPDPYLPPPAAIDETSEVLSAVLDGHVTPDELAPLESRHLYADLHRALWDAARECAPGDVDGVLRILAARGWRGALEHELSRLVVDQPWVCLSRLREHVATIIDAWRRRQLLAGLQALELALRRESITTADAVARLAELTRVT